MFDPQNGKRVTLAPWATLLAIVMSGLVAPHLCAAQSVSASEREALVRLRVDRGGRAEDVDTLIRQAEDAASKGLPAGALTNKIREGLAKGADPKRIESVLRQMTTNLETADRLVREMNLPSGGAGRDASLTLLAESLGAGVTVDEVRDIRQQAQSSGKSPLPLEGLANGAKGLSFIKEARLSGAEGSAVIVEAIRQGFRPPEVLDLGRDIKRRENDFRAGRASLSTLRDAIRRGDRPDQLFRTSRPEVVDRPTSARPERPADPPERPAPPDRPQRPEQPDRPERAPAGR